MSENQNRHETIADAEAGIRPLPLDELLASEEARTAFDAHGDVLDVGELIREMRTAKKLSQDALAELAGTTQARISELERGRGRQGPSIELLARVARACGEPLAFVRRSELDQLHEQLAAARLELARLRKDVEQAEASRRSLDGPKDPPAESGLVKKTASATVRWRSRRGGAHVDVSVIPDVANKVRMSPRKVEESVVVFLEEIGGALSVTQIVNVPGVGVFSSERSPGLAHGTGFFWSSPSAHAGG